MHERLFGLHHRRAARAHAGHRRCRGDGLGGQPRTQGGHRERGLRRRRIRAGQPRNECREHPHQLRDLRHPGPAGRGTAVPRLHRDGHDSRCGGSCPPAPRSRRRAARRHGPSPEEAEGYKEWLVGVATATSHGAQGRIEASSAEAASRSTTRNAPPSPRCERCSGFRADRHPWAAKASASQDAQAAVSAPWSTSSR